MMNFKLVAVFLFNIIVLYKKVCIVAKWAKKSLTWGVINTTM